MQRSTTRILTTHAGSLPRPEALTRLYVRRAKGEAVDEAALAEAGRASVPAILDKQIAAGIDVVANGEQQRESFVLYLRRRLSGLGGQGSRRPTRDVTSYPLFQERWRRQQAAAEAVSNRDDLPKCIGPVAYQGHSELSTEIADFKAALADKQGRYVEPFFTAASPGILAAIVRNEHYDTFERYLDAIADALAIEYRAIIDAGFVLQLDCPDLALERHGSFQDRPLGDFVGFVETVVASINRAIAGLPRERIRLHCCWGNYEAPHDCDVPLADILPAIRQANVGAFFFPFANPRHAHEYKVLKKQPLADDQVLIAGVIDTLTNFVEHPEVVADRLERICDAMGDPTRVIAGTDCGFDTSAGMGRVAEDVVWAKLKAMSEGARLASERVLR
jgi:5-methyltetrahydropteroyltriglutamate--homocysteine methyltransferase